MDRLPEGYRPLAPVNAGRRGRAESPGHQNLPERAGLVRIRSVRLSRRAFPDPGSVCSMNESMAIASPRSLYLTKTRRLDHQPDSGSGQVRRG